MPIVEFDRWSWIQRIIHSACGLALDVGPVLVRCHGQSRIQHVSFATATVRELGRCVVVGFDDFATPPALHETLVQELVVFMLREQLASLGKDTRVEHHGAPAAPLKFDQVSRLLALDLLLVDLHLHGAHSDVDKDVGLQGVWCMDCLVPLDRCHHISLRFMQTCLRLVLQIFPQVFKNRGRSDLSVECDKDCGQFPMVLVAGCWRRFRRLLFLRGVRPGRFRRCAFGGLLAR
mmetsp:Transcript_104646/g.337318  ORF Transcript_104646/g.337318 Transcript_104646/m.337318 type:complete len:233 (+) Transcript_104646:570-1268(+)